MTSNRTLFECVRDCVRTVSDTLAPCPSERACPALPPPTGEGHTRETRSLCPTTVSEDPPDTTWIELEPQGLLARFGRSIAAARAARRAGR